MANALSEPLIRWSSLQSAGAAPNPLEQPVNNFRPFTDLICLINNAEGVRVTLEGPSEPTSDFEMGTGPILGVFIHAVERA